MLDILTEGSYFTTLASKPQIMAQLTLNSLCQKTMQEYRCISFVISFFQNHSKSSLWALGKLKKPVSQSDGSLPAEKEGHISVELASVSNASQKCRIPL